jgi:hypothetical protein
MALEGFAVVADLFDDVESPAVVQLEHFAEIAFGTEESLHHGVGVLRLLVDILRGDS